jgi:hypothetical protein
MWNVLLPLRARRTIVPLVCLLAVCAHGQQPPGGKGELNLPLTWWTDHETGLEYEIL